MALMVQLMLIYTMNNYDIKGCIQNETEKMIVVDLDGTLLNSNHKCTETSKNYLMN